LLNGVVSANVIVKKLTAEKIAVPQSTVRILKRIILDF
jgi:hypothetical protein